MTITKPLGSCERCGEPATDRNPLRRHSRLREHVVGLLDRDVTQGDGDKR